MHKLICFVYLIILGISSLEAADKAKMLQDLDIIKSTFETKYAPYEWKKSYFGWSLEEEINFAKIKVLSLDSLSVKDYQKILHGFFISTRDYHVGDQYHCTEMAMLPFNVKSINGRYFITEIDKQMLTDMRQCGLYTGKTLPQVGNELILFDSQPVADTVEEIKFQCLGNPTSKTSQTLAEPLLTKRLGSRGHSVPQGPLKISFKTAEGIIINANIEWLYQPEKIANHSYMTVIPLSGNILSNALDTDYADDFGMELEPYSEALEKNVEIDFFAQKPKLMINPLAQDLQKDYTPQFKKILDQYKKQHFQLGMHAEDQSLPSTAAEPSENVAPAIERNSISIGKTIWEETPKSTFKVRIFELPRSERGANRQNHLTGSSEHEFYQQSAPAFRIGYLRISTYSPSQDDNAITQLVIRLAKSIRYLELHTDALVVDQVDNPGGIDLYALAMASMLTDRPLKLPKNHLALTQAEIAKAFNAIDSLEDLKTSLPDVPTTYTASSFLVGYPIDKEFINSEISYQSFLINQWNKGKTLTEAYPLSGIEYLLPHPLASYSKPILVLVNSNDFSCGDFFPAILQDNKRAVIFGEQTAGAGGFVEKHSYPNTFGLAQFTYTSSIAERLDGSVIENLGVTPDVPYDLTEDDLLHGYQGYIKAIQATLEQMLKGT